MINEINLTDLPKTFYIYKYPKIFININKDITWTNTEEDTLIAFNNIDNKIVITIPEGATIGNNIIDNTFEINVTNGNNIKVTIQKHPDDFFTHINNNLNINVKKEKVGDNDKYSFFIDETIDETQLSRGGGCKTQIVPKKITQNENKKTSPKICSKKSSSSLNKELFYFIHNKNKIK
jgi:hypothetical protein